MDCFKDFDRETFNLHTQCVTELQRYSGKDYVQKANVNKGQRKQEAWVRKKLETFKVVCKCSKLHSFKVDLVRSITEKKLNLSSGVKKILETISSFDNIPRKKAKFLNFMRNSFRYMKMNELEEAWALLEEAMKENKAENAAPMQNAKKDEITKGNAQNGHKRKLDEEEELKEASEEPEKKKKKDKSNGRIEDSLAEESSVCEKFSWSETIKNILSAKNNELKLKKLRSKIVRKYQSFTGGEWSDKVENKFNKKINKLKGIVVKDEKVRLIE